MTVNVQKRQRWTISVYYSVKDLSATTSSIWTTGSNSLASFNIYSRTNEELTHQLADAQEQISDVQEQFWGFIFIAVYVAVTLGIVAPFIQRRTYKIAKKTNNEDI